MFGSLKVSQRKFDEEVIGLEFISTCSFFGLKLLNLTHPDLNYRLSYNIFLVFNFRLASINARSYATSPTTGSCCSCSGGSWQSGSPRWAPGVIFGSSGCPTFCHGPWTPAHVWTLCQCTQNFDCPTRSCPTSI